MGKPRIVVCLPKGTEFLYGEREYLAKRDYYTTVIPRDFGDLHEIAVKGSRNIKKQIAMDMGEIYKWQIVDFYDRHLEMEYAE